MLSTVTESLDTGRLTRKFRLKRAGDGSYKDAHQHECLPSPLQLNRNWLSSLTEFILTAFHDSPEGGRPSFEEIEEVVLDIYGQTNKKPYTRQRPDPVSPLAGALDNRAVSLMDLAHGGDAGKHQERARTADPGHLDSSFNLVYAQWQNGKTDPVAYLTDISGCPDLCGNSSECCYDLSIPEPELGLVKEGRKPSGKVIQFGCEEAATKKILWLEPKLLGTFGGTHPSQILFQIKMVLRKRLLT